MCAPRVTQVNFYEGPPFKFKGTAKSHERFPNCVRYSPDGEKFFSVGSDQVCAGRTACTTRTAAPHRLRTADTRHPPSATRRSTRPPPAHPPPRTRR